ncbi:unnamed protein product [[Candida] boidinii]|nr:unnamed protein product [[Candida] boidinii]
MSKKIVLSKDTDNWDIKRDLWHGYNADKGFEEQLEKWEDKKKKELENKQNASSKVDLEGLDEDELEEMRELGLLNDNENNGDERNKSGMKSSLAKEDLNSSLIAPPESKISVRSMDEKPRYLEVLKTGEELKYNPKSRTYKDASEGYFNDRGQFVRYLTGEAQEFEKLKKFAWQLNSDTRAEFLGNKEYGKRNSKNLVDLKNNAEVSPTGLMLAMKQKQKEEEMNRMAKRQELLMKYGIATNGSSDSNGTSGEVLEDKNAASTVIKTDNTYYEYDKTGKIKTKTDMDLEIIEKYRKKMES